MGNQLIHNCINDILRISLSISNFQIGILNQEFLLKIDFESDKTTKYIIFKHNLINWYIILSSNFQGKFIKGKYSIPNQPSHEFCRVHEIMAPKKNTQTPNSQKSQSSQANQSPSPHKMLWSQQVEQEEKEAQLLAKLHSSKPMHESNYMPNKMLTLYYDHSDHSKPVKVTQYPAISGSQTFKQITMANPSQKELATISSTSKQIVVAANPTPLSIKSRYWQNDLNQPLLAIEREFFFLKILERLQQKLFMKIFIIPLVIFQKQEIFMKQFIETGSVKIKHNADKFSKLDLAFSTYHIYKILTVKQWGGNPNFSREFSEPSKPRFFNYWDYQKAWFTFLIQNRDFHHSWMFYFPSKNQLSSFPFWFHNWWTYFGPSIKILPKPILDGFELFSSFFIIPKKLSIREFSRVIMGWSWAGPIFCHWS